MAMWSQMEKPKTLQATRALIKEFNEMSAPPYDRPLSERRLQVYERILQAGEFRPVTWASAFCEETNETYRVNGKHTSMLLAGMDKVPEFFVTVERYSCPTQQDVAKLYNTFDSRLGTRTNRDINLAFAATMPEIAHINRRYIHYAVTAAAYGKWGDSYNLQPPTVRAELLLDEGEFVVWLSDVLLTQGKQYAHIHRQPVVNAMYKTHSKAKAAATEFWGLVREETHTEAKNPTRVIARYLARVNVASGQGAKPGRQLASAREMYVKCLHAWNAWRQNAVTDLKYYADAKPPSVV